MKSKIFLSVFLMVFSASLFACLAPDESKMSATNPSYSSITLNYTGFTSSPKQMRYRIKGTTSWSDPITFNGQFVVANTLQLGKTYQYQCRLNCGIATSWGSWGPNTPKEFYTLSCPVPQNHEYNELPNFRTESSTTLSNTASGTQREVRYKRNSITAFIWTTLTSTGTSFAINGLSPNTSYEFQARVICGSHTTTWTSSKTFTTLQSCNAPAVSQLSHTNVTATSATINTSDSGVFRKFRYKRQNTTTWIESPANLTNAWSIPGLASGTTYEYQASVKCSQNSSWSAYSGSNWFTTTQTCPSPSVSQISNSIPTATSVTLYNNATGTSKDIRYRKVSTSQWFGYTLINGSSWNVSGLSPGTTYEFQASVKCTNGIWSSYSATKTFSTVTNSVLTITPTQLTFNASNNVAKVITVTSNVSWTAKSSTANHGQSSQLHWLRTGINGSTLSTVNGTNNGSFQIAVLPNQGATRYGTVTVSTNGITRTINVTQYGTSGRPALSNNVQFESALSLEFENDSNNIVKSELSHMEYRSAGDAEHSFNIAPNPTNGNFSISLELTDNDPINLELYNTNGRLMHNLKNGTLELGVNRLDFDYSMLPAGSYFVRYTQGSKIITKKLMIVK